ncbi:mycofactocin precursor MftA [Streptomyces sp. NPDC005648]|uniref:mycofactocin precursor MftA n=1 Tax=Streptomyces sp. NPDC005648 TaxID=3157044 RepID=UPI00339F9A2C
MSEVTRTLGMETATVDRTEAEPPLVDDRALEDDLMVEEDLLVEEVSIDGMCGVY